MDAAQLTDTEPGEMPRGLCAWECLLMVVCIMLLPAITARFWAQDISNMILVAVAAALAASLIGLLVSYYANLPTGPAIILTAGAGYLISMLIGVQGGLLWQLMPRKHLEA